MKKMMMTRRTTNKKMMMMMMMMTMKMMMMTKVYSCYSFFSFSKSVIFHDELRNPSGNYVILFSVRTTF